MAVTEGRTALMESRGQCITYSAVTKSKEDRPLFDDFEAEGLGERELLLGRRGIERRTPDLFRSGDNHTHLLFLFIYKSESNDNTYNSTSRSLSRCISVVTKININHLV